MELREASNGEEMLQVEKRLDRQRRIEEAKSVQAAERLRARTSVFDIINKKLGSKGIPVFLLYFIPFNNCILLVEYKSRNDRIYL